MVWASKNPNTNQQPHYHKKKSVQPKKVTAIITGSDLYVPCPASKFSHAVAVIFLTSSNFSNLLRWSSKTSNQMIKHSFQRQTKNITIVKSNSVIRKTVHKSQKLIYKLTLQYTYLWRKMLISLPPHTILLEMALMLRVNLLS